MIFHSLSVQDIPILQDAAIQSTIPSRICDITPGCLILWRKYYKTEICVSNNVVYTRLYDVSGVPHYNYPLAEKPADAIMDLIKSEKHNSPLFFCTIPASETSIFSELFPSCDIIPQRQFSDYIYLQSELSELKGRKFSGQRNQINRFMKENSDWSFEPLSQHNAPLAAKMLQNVFLSDNSMPDAAMIENESILEILASLDKYPVLQGAILLSKGRALGLALGEQIGDTLYVHAEKADRNITGAYQMVVNQFAKLFTKTGVTFINREDDNGDEGLRKAKLAYHPYEIIDKYLIKISV